MNNERERVISISLSDVEWQAFVACQPKPVDWLRARIVEAVAASSRNEPQGHLGPSPQPLGRA